MIHTIISNRLSVFFRNLKWIFRRGPLWAGVILLTYDKFELVPYWCLKTYSWLDNNVGEYGIHWKINCKYDKFGILEGYRIYFRNVEDLTMFKLTWL